jgi:D-alanyl-D-alanine carboxypeptidase
MKKSILKSITFCFLTVTVSAQNNPKITDKDVIEINQLVDDLSNKDTFSGTVLIAKGNEIIYQKAVGFANKESNIKSNIDTKFNLASMNKMFTGIAIAQLAEKNKLSYTDKVVKYLPNLPEKILGNITIEQLLTHTSGTGDFHRMSNFMEIKDTAKTINSYVALGINETLLFEPGAKFEYSNYGYILLGAVIEKISKTSYFDYVKNNIFSIAGMKNTDSYESDKTNENMAIGYAMPPPMPGETPKPMGEKIMREPNTPFIEVKGTSAGGGYSSAIDLHKFSQALLSGKLLSKNSLETVTKGKVLMQFAMPPMPPNAKPMPMPEVKYGFGFGESFKNNIRIIGHSGGAPGVEGKIDIYPDLGYTVIVLSNYDRASRPITNFIEAIITKKN